MKIAIVGTGYVGLVTGTCLAEIDAGGGLGPQEKKSIIVGEGERRKGWRTSWP